MTDETLCVVPSGWRIVPVETNWDMRNEGREVLIDGLERDLEKRADLVWKAMVASAPAPPQVYSIDDDPAGIRARTAHAIRGAMAYGAMNTNPPPAGHWLTEFWNLGRADGVPSTSDGSPQ